MNDYQKNLNYFKAEVLNDFVKKHQVQTIVELDGLKQELIDLFDFDIYQGLTSDKQIQENYQKHYAHRLNFNFELLPIKNNNKFKQILPEMALSLNILSKLRPNNTWDDYLKTLFSLARRFVVIYFKNNPENQKIRGEKHTFITYLQEKFPQWALVGFIPNKYNDSNQNQSNFYFFSLNEQLNSEYAVYQNTENLTEISAENSETLMQKAKYSFSIGNQDEAIKYLKQIIINEPSDLKALNNLGVILLSQNPENEQSEKLFKLALAHNPNYLEAYCNLGLLYLKNSKWEKAHPFLSALKIYSEEKDPSLKSLIEKAHQMINLPFEKITSLAKDNAFKQQTITKKQLLSIFCLPNFDSFIEPILKAAQNKFNINKIILADTKYAYQNDILKSDLIWLEWGNQLTIFLMTKYPQFFKNKRVFCRIHSYEVIDNLISQINFAPITDLVFVSNFVKELFLKAKIKFPKQTKLHVIPNAIDLQKFPLIKRINNKHIAFLGTIDFKKDPMLLVQAFDYLYKKDPQFKLSVAGSNSNLRYQLGLEHFIKINNLENNVKFDGQINDVPTWLIDKNYIICTSCFESHGVGLCEALATGCRPLICNFPKANEIYPEDFLWNNISELKNMLFEKAPRTAEDYRNFIKKNYSQELFNERFQQAVFENKIVDFKLNDN